MQEKLLILRKRNNWTQEYIANYLNVSTRTYSDKEAGKIKFNCDEMFKLARLFNEKMEDIFLPTIHQNGVEKDGE